jgi:uncharacterized protein (TIGR01777 family)
VGWYGPRAANEDVDETSAPGRDYMAQLADQWERALGAAGELGVRVVHARFGVVLGKGGGAIEKMARPFRFHVGGPIGSGKQVMSWIHIEDACGIVLLAIDRDVRGAVNVTSPDPADMDRFSKAIGTVLRRRSYLRVPETAVRALFGEGAEPLLSGQRVLPRVAQRLGYEFQYPELVPALRSVLRPDEKPAAS